MPSAPENSIAVVDALGRVVTFVRLDVPEGWNPPEGLDVMPSEALPEGWQFAPQEPTPVPASVTRRQLKQWLILNGKLDAVNAALAAIPDAMQRALAQVWFADALEFERAHPLVSAVGDALEMTGEEIDAAWIAAAQL